MHIVLVNPPASGNLEPWYDQPVYGRTALACLAGFLRERSHHQVTIVDAKFERLGFEEAQERVLTLKPDVVGLTAFTNEIKPAAYMAAKLKNRLPGLKTVIGGVHLTALPIETMQEFTSFDFGVFGEGEITLLELLNSLEQGAFDIGHIAGLVFRAEGRVLKNSPRQRSTELDEMPYPAWDLLPPAKTYYVQTQRGCPFNCVFCMNPNGLAARLRSPENVIEELKWIVEEFKPEQISFGDELFSVNIERTHRLLDLMIEHKIGEKVKWEVQTHIRFVDDRLFAKMKKANVHLVELGIESGDSEKLSKLGKGSNLNLIKKACASAKRNGVRFGTFFIIGHPNEDVSSIRKTINLAVEVNPDVPMFGVMVPYPGTEVSRLAAKGEGGYKLASRNWDEYNKQLGGALEFSSFSRRKIELLQIEAYFKVFVFNGRLLNFLKVFWQYQKGAISLLKKMIFKKSKLQDLLDLPEDYEMTLKEWGWAASLSDETFIQARNDWKNWQKQELVRAKKTTGLNVRPVEL